MAGAAVDDPGCVKTLRGITVPGILGPVVMRRAKKHKNLSSARHDDQIGFRFRTAKTHSVGSTPSIDALRKAYSITSWAIASSWADRQKAWQEH